MDRILNNMKNFIINHRSRLDRAANSLKNFLIYLGTNKTKGRHDR